MISILEAPPYATVQDAGRSGYRSQGVPLAGAMDSWALGVANVLVGNDAGAAALEWSLGAGRLQWERPAVFALAGAPVDATLDGAPLAMHRSYRAGAGSELVVRRPEQAQFVYIAVDGAIEVAPVLKSRATYLPARMGGIDGRRLRSGDRLTLGPPPRVAPAPGFAVPADLEPRYDAPDCRVIAGPHSALFPAAAWTRFTTESYRLDSASDRTGYRLTGPRLEHHGDAALPSAPLCPGAIQIPSGGQPIVLMADAPTVGGYPVIAVVCSADLPWIAQRRPGEMIRFRVVTIDAAQRALRRRAVAVHTIAALARERGS